MPGPQADARAVVSGGWIGSMKYLDGQWLKFYGEVPGAHTAGEWTLGIFRPAESIIFRTPAKKTIRQPARVIPLTVHGEPIRLGARDWRNLQRIMPGILPRLEPPRTEFLLVAFDPDSLPEICPVLKKEQLPPGLIFRQFYRESELT